MKMKMKSRLLYAPMVMVVMSSLVGLTSTTTHKPRTTTHKPRTTTHKPRTTTTSGWTPTTGASGLDLNGKMFTLSINGGGISFYSPYYSPTTPPYSTTRYTTYPYTTTRPWTTAPPTRGVSVCLRYLTDYLADIPKIFTLSPSSRSPLQMGVSSTALYRLSFDRYGYNNQYLQPYKRFWSNIGPDFWTRVCLTVDTVKNVAQVFSGSNMSIRKLLPTKYVWSGEPVIDFSGFDGQVTDVQVWDYPLHYREVFNYMNYRSYSGSALSWSYISYSPRGDVLLEDAYQPQWQDRQPISRSKERKWRRPKGEKKKKRENSFNETHNARRQKL
ncbi:uncharacterized protein LOC120555264 [Perca fluviatilis]|nr:uncharacterized protein LOC120555264 [Perca fluviatilis]